MGKKKERINIVYSTNSSFEYETEHEYVEDTLTPENQNLKVYIEKKGRGGKTASVIKGFVGTEEDINSLSRLLKAKCGVGGAVKNGEIIIQGDQREKVVILLTKNGYGVKKAGG